MFFVLLFVMHARPSPSTLFRSALCFVVVMAWFSLAHSTLLLIYFSGMRIYFLDRLNYYNLIQFDINLLSMLRKHFFACMQTIYGDFN